MNHRYLALLKIFLFTCLPFFSICQSQIALSSFIELSQGYNIYHPVEKYFYNYQNMTISEFTSQQDGRDYRMCFVGQERKPSLQFLSTHLIFSSQASPSNKKEVLYNLDDFLKMDRVLDSHYNYQSQILYLISAKELKVIQILENKIKIMTNLTLNDSITEAEFIQTQNGLHILTDSKVYALKHSNENNLDLQVIKTIQNDDQIYLNVFIYDNQLVYVTDDAINVVYSQENGGDQIKNRNKKQFTNFDYDIQNVFFFNENDMKSNQKQIQQKLNNNFLMVFDQQYTYVTFNLDLATNQSLKFDKFTKISQGNKCTAAHKWFNYVFLECRNHLIYIDVLQIQKCRNQDNSVEQKCLNQLKFSHINIGYHIKSIQFTSFNGNNRLVIMGLDKYEVRSISTTSSPSNHEQKIILSITPLATFYPNLNLHKVYLIDANTSLILSKTKFSIYSQLSETKEIFCKTVDENTHTLLDQPAGNFNGTLTVEGFCLDLVHQDSLIEILNDNICRLTVPVTVKVNAEVKNYQFVWYILVSAIAAIVAAIIAYCIFKKISLNKQYKLFENQKDHGQQVLEQTMVTEPNQDSSFAK